MADRRRRKRASQDSEEEDESGSSTESGGLGSAPGKATVNDLESAALPSPRIRSKSEEESECESEDGIGEAVLSDYDSADPEENCSQSEGEEEDIAGKQFSDEGSKPHAEEKSSDDKPCAELLEQVVVVDQGEDDEEDRDKDAKTEDRGNLAGERQSGDGQESTDDPENKTRGKASKKLDDDEDRKNPAYIPRKGLFFEHDVRGQAHADDIRPKTRHRKLWKDEGRWEHDKFREDEQAPKSREELIAMYGYDIRNANGPSDGRLYRARKPRYSTSPSRVKRWRNGEKPNRTSWPNGGSSTNSAANTSHSSAQPTPSAPHPSRFHSGGGRTVSHSQSRSFHGSRPLAASYRDNRVNYKACEENHSQQHNQGAFGRGGYVHHESERGSGQPARNIEAECSPSVLVEEELYHEDEEQPKPQPGYYNKQSESASRDSPQPRRQEEPLSEAALPRDASPAAPERTVERKSYSLARRTRNKLTDLSKQASLDDAAPQAPSAPQQALPSVKSENWEPPADRSGVQSGLSGLDQDLARLSLAGQNWAQSPPSYLRAEMRGIHNSMHMPGGPPQFGRLEEIGVGGGRAKRYSSQRQRPVPEPAPMHIGIMEGHYYDPMSFQGPIYTHSESPTPLPPQGMLVQPEMHLPHPAHPGHPGLHPHQSGAAIPNPAMYAGPPVSMPPGQPPPQQLMAPPFYPPPGVMTFGNTNFPYPAGATLPPMYPNPQAQAQVYGGVTYYDTMQQQAQPKPSPPRRSSQPVTIKPPPPEGEKNGKEKDKSS
ncbi:protein CASC3 [Paramormyrops kingsleyae]|uniref:Protein CASC3 n=1 Tax=Paramormyrops kingsleyae TaxID=1676925 RepID=A0A3B3QKC2_9TELE|nr:protein CASC3 [Paramormyrops kingsleyae]